MAVFERWFKQDLLSPVTTYNMGEYVFTEDNLSNIVGVELYRGGVPATLSGTVNCYAIRSDGSSVLLRDSGTISNNKVSITLPKSVIQIPGKVGIMLQIENGDTKTTVLKAVMYSVLELTNTVIDPEHVVPDLSDIIAQMAAMEAATSAATAATDELVGGMDDIIKIQSTEPQEEFNKVWFDTSETSEFVVPTIDDDAISDSDTWSSEMIAGVTGIVVDLTKYEWWVGTISSNGNDMPNTYVITCEYIPVTPGAKFTVDINGNCLMGGFYDSDKRWIRNMTDWKHSEVIPDGVSYFRPMVRGAAWPTITTEDIPTYVAKCTLINKLNPGVCEDYTDNKRVIDISEESSYFTVDYWETAVGGSVTAYPTRVKFYKHAFNTDVEITFNELLDRSFGPSYQVSYETYAADDTVVIPDTGWHYWHDVISVRLSKGQKIMITCKFAPVEADTSQTGALDAIAEVVRFRILGLQEKIYSNIQDCEYIPYLRKDALANDNYYTIYIPNYGTWEWVTNHPGTCKDGTTSVNSTAVMIRSANGLTIWPKNGPYGSDTGVNKSWSDICTAVGNSNVMTIDGKDYVVIYSDKSLCYDPVAKTFRLVGRDDNINGYIMLLNQRARQITGGYVAPKFYYDILDAKIDSEINDVRNAYAPSKSVIKAVRDASKENGLTFVWMSDTHCQHNAGSAYGVTMEFLSESAAVAECVGADFIVHTGDVANGHYARTYQADDYADIMTAFSKSTVPVYILEGNHDDNSWYVYLRGQETGTYPGVDEVFSNNHATSYLMNNKLNDVVVDPNNPLGGYWYKDFAKSKIRVIGLNTTDIPYIENLDHSLKYYGHWTFGFQADQVNWIANTALKFDEAGWGVVFFMHFDGQLDDAVGGGMADPKVWYYVKEIIAAYIAKTSGMFTSNVEDFPMTINYDFTNNPSNEVIAYFSGHVHLDENETIGGVPHMSIVCAYNDGVSGHDGPGFDIVTLDRTNKKIKTIRYNGGEMSEYNREITW